MSVDHRVQKECLHPLKECRVLLAEDEPLIALDLQASLEEIGCTVLGPVSSVATAHELLKDGLPDIALLDFQLSDGPVTPLAVTLTERRIPFLVMTGYGAADMLAPVLRSAPRIEKPFDFARLTDMIQSLLPR
jgi:DNA-binding NtrC family response regulator